MGKTTNRVISLVLAVLMVISMVSAFALPAMAEESATVSTALDYDALLKGSNTFFINSSWSSRDLQTGKTLDFTFQNKNVKLTYNAKRHFASYADAFDEIWGGLTAANYFTYNPVIVFAPGEYDTTVQLVGPCTVLGNNAGISPNQARTEDNWNTKYLKENNGWAANPNRGEETYFSAATCMSVNTRDPGDGGAGMPTSGEGAKWAVLKEQAFAANSSGVFTTVIDGVKFGGSKGVHHSGYDVGKTAEYNGKKVTAAGSRQVLTRIQYSDFTTTAALATAWNTNNDYFNVELDNVRSTGVKMLVERYVDSIKINDSYIANYTGILTEELTVRSKHSATFEMQGSILYNGPATGNLAAFNGDPSQNNFTFKLTDSLLYNAAGANYGVFLIYNTKGYDQFFTIQNNDIYHDYANTQTYFNGNNKYITNGRVYINFNNNRLISPTIKSFVPNSQYDEPESSTILYYNFDNNYWATSHDKTEVGKPVTFLAGPNGGAPLASGWDYKDPNYFYDYNMTYSSNGTDIVGADFGEGNTVEVKSSNIRVKCFDAEGTVTPEFFFDESKLGSAMPKYEMATDIGFADKIESIDLSAIDGSATFYVRGYYEGTDYESVYKISIVAAKPVDFNDDFMANGLKFAGYDLNYKNTGILVKDTVVEGDETVAYGFLGTNYFRFKVDNDLVFKSLDELKTQMARVKDPYVVLPSGEYGTFNVDFAATYIGANADIDPVDDTVSVLDDGSDWAIGEGWGDYGETGLGNINVADGVEGKLVFNGITMRGQFNDTERTMGSEGIAYGDLDITVKNVVIDQDGTAGSSDSRSAYVKSISMGGSGANYMFNIINARNVNFDDTQVEYDQYGIPTTVDYPGFGESCNESFTIDSLWVKNASSTPRFMNEFVAPHTTIKNLYRDNTASKSDTIISWAKVGAAVKNGSFTFVNNNIRNSVNEEKDHPVLGVEGATRKNAAMRLPEGSTYDVTISDNVFYNGQRDKAEGMKILSLEAAFYSSLNVNNNFVYADDSIAKTCGFIGYSSAYDKNLGADDLAVIGNISLDSNKFIGINEDVTLVSLAMGKNTPYLTNAFVTTDTETYLTNNKAGINNPSIGSNDYWLNYDGSITINSVRPLGLEPKTDKVSGHYLDNSKMEIGAIVSEGKLSDIGIILPEGVTGMWYTDEECTDAFEDKTVEEIGYNAVYYYKATSIIGEDVFEFTYKAEIYTVEFIDFADAEGFDPDYFSNKAVIVTDKAAGLAVGSIVVEEWDGVKYRFYAGINAFETLQLADDSSAVPEILVPKATQENGVLNGSLDLVVNHSMKIYGPNYKTNPVINDGYSYDSPTKGEGWGYNTEYDKHKDDVRIKSVSVWTPAGDTVIEIYGFTIDSAVNDNGRQVGSTVKFKLVNTLFTTTKGSGYIFTNQAYAHNTHYDYILSSQRNELYVKNAYFGSETSGKDFRLMGELIPAKVTFDNIHLDFIEAGLTNTSYIKNTSSDSSIVFKNSYLKSSMVKGNNGHLQFEGLLIDGGDGYKAADKETGRASDDKEKSTVPDGWKSQLVFDNNIIDGYLGYARDNTSNAMFRMNGASYNDIQITNNYLNFPAAMGYYSSGSDTTKDYKIVYGDSTAMWWSMAGKAAENGGDITNLKGKYVVTSNVMVGLKATRLDYGNGGESNCLSGYDVVIEDNFITKNASVDAFDPNVIGVPAVTRAKDQSGVGFYRLNASGTITSKTVNDYSFADRVTKSGSALSITGYENDLYTKVEGGYEFDLSAIIGENIYGNVFTASYGDGEAVDVKAGKVAVTADAFPAAGFTFTVTVDSIQGNAENKEVYTLTVKDGGAAPAFKGNYVNDTIKDTALVISAEADGTATVYERWQGMTYSFVSGTNAFKTVEDALAYAKTNALENVQIILIDTDLTTDITVTYPCTLYGVNYDVLPHLKDGDGPDSPTNGEGWKTNVEYLDDQTHVDMIVLGEGFPTGGTFEVYGVTMHGPYADNRTTKENVAKVKLQNILLDLGTTTHTGNNKYLFDLQSTPSQNTAGNEFKLINTNLYAAAPGRAAIAFIYGEWGPQTVVIDNFYVRDAAALKYDQSTAYIKSPANGASITITNSCFRSSIVQTTGRVEFEAMGSKTTETDTTKKTDLYFTNNIFSTMLGRDTSSSALFIVYAHAVDDCHFINNYVDNAKGTGTFGDLVYWGSIKIGDGGTIPNEIVTALQMNFVVKDNVLNGQTNTVVQATPSGKTGTIKITAENNYRTSAYVDDAYYAGVLGESLLIHSSNIQASTPYYALNYARDAYDKTIGVPEYEMLENLIVEADNSVTYKPDDKLFVDGGAIHGTVDHIVKTYPAYNTIKLVVDGVEKDIDATIAAATSVAIRLYATNGVNFKDFAVNVTSETNHNFVDFDVIVPATCISDAIGGATCDGSCGDTDCTAYTTKVLVGTSAEADHSWPARGVSNGDGTCQANGTWTFTCTVDGCGETKTEEQPDSTVPHKFNNGDYVAHEPATCGKAGTEIANCAFGCGETDVRTNATKYPIDKKGHVWGEFVYNNDATCVVDGTETRECTVCYAPETRKCAEHLKESVAHTWGEYVYNGDVTCKTDGTMTARCTVDGCRARDTVADPNFKADVKYHQLTEYTYNNDATCCEDGTKTAVCSVCETKVTVAAPGTATGHKDVSGNYKDVAAGKWYNNAINYNVAHGFISGVAKDEFGVGVNVTRGMFVTILARIAGVETTKNAVATKFTDVAQNKYYTAAVKWASENAVVNGMTATTFAPDAAITRQQLAVMIVNFAKAQKIELTAKNAAVTFADAGQIANWAKDAVSACQKAGIISGYTENGATTFKPNNTATRAEAAQMVYKFHSEFINK